MLTTNILICVYGSGTIGALLYVALILQRISAKIDSFHNDVWHQIYKDRI